MLLIQQFIYRYLKLHSWISRYAIAVGSVIAMLILRAFLHPVLGERSQYTIFLLAVLLTVRYSGSVPALVALALGALLGNTFFDQPYFTFKLGDVRDVLDVLLYLTIGLAIIYIFSLVKRRERQLAAQIIKQEEVENALLTSEQRFRLVTEALEGAIYDWDAITAITYRSSGLFEIIGYRPDEVPNSRMWWLEQIHPDDYAGVQQALQKRIAERAPTHSVEYRIRHKDGQFIWVWDRSRLLYNAEGQLIRISGITLSIDERMKLVESLAQTEERFQVAFENATDAMALSDAEGIVLAANEAYFQLYGYSAEEVLGQNYAIIFPEETRQQSMESYQKVFHEQHELPFYESTVKRRDGTVRIVEARVGFIAAHGKRQYMLSVVRDLTERKQTENAIYSRYRLTANLAQAVTVEDVGKITIDYLMEQLGARVGTIYIYHDSDNTLELLYANTAWVASGALNNWQRFPADPAFPMSDVVKNKKPLWFSSTEHYEADYPAMKRYTHFNSGAAVLLPLVGTEEVFGVINLLFSEIRTFTDEEKALITSLVIQCTQAIERARLAGKAQTLAVIEERHRLARDLHDNVSQLLFSSSVISEMLPRLLTKKPETAIKQAEELHLMVRGAMAEMRTLLWELRPENILQTKLSGLLTQLAYAAEARQDIKVSLVVHANNEFILPADAQVTFYRIAQESIHNVYKHGQSTAISISVRQTERYTALFIADNGHGFVADTASGGFGLRNMQERAAKIGAQLGIKSQVGKGTRIRLLWSVPS